MAKTEKRPRRDVGTSRDRDVETETTTLQEIHNKSNKWSMSLNDIVATAMTHSSSASSRVRRNELAADTLRQFGRTRTHCVKHKLYGRLTILYHSHHAMLLFYSLLRHWGNTYTIKSYTVDKTIKQKYHSRKNLTEVHKHEHNHIFYIKA